MSRKGLAGDLVTDAVGLWAGPGEGVPDRVWIAVLVPLWVGMLLGLRVAEAVLSALVLWVRVGLRVAGGVALHEGVAGWVVEWLEVMAVVGVPERVTRPEAVAVLVWLAVGGGLGAGVAVALFVLLHVVIRALPGRRTQEPAPPPPSTRSV